MGQQALCTGTRTTCCRRTTSTDAYESIKLGPFTTGGAERPMRVEWCTRTLTGVARQFVSCAIYLSIISRMLVFSMIELSSLSLETR